MNPKKPKEKKGYQLHLPYKNIQILIPTVSNRMTKSDHLIHIGCLNTLKPLNFQHPTKNIGNCNGFPATTRKAHIFDSQPDLLFPIPSRNSHATFRYYVHKVGLRSSRPTSLILGSLPRSERLMANPSPTGWQGNRWNQKENWQQKICRPQDTING